MSDVDSILFGGRAAKKTAAPKTYDPRDAAIRTIMAEESDPTAREWVAGVIANRAKASGKNFYDVVTEKNQFEPWARGTAQKVDPNSDDYKATAAKVADILDGKRDPSGGMTHFYAPDAQAELAKQDGRPAKAEFDDGTGTRVGSTLFFKKGGGEQAAAEPGHDLDDLLFAEKPAGVDLSKSAAPGAGEVAYTKGPGSLDKGQTEVLGTFEKGGFIDRNAPVGSERNPRWMTEDTTEADVAPGEYYVTRSSKDAKAVLKRAPGGDDKSSFTEGLSRGAGDVALSVSRALPGSGDSELQNRFSADQMLYDAQRKGDLKSGTGRFLGQVAVSAPFIAGGEALVAPKLAAAIPAVANPIVRGGMLAAKGAVEGASAAGLTSSASDAPIEEQLAAGAAGGAVLGPLTPAAKFLGKKAGHAVRSYVEPLTEKGLAKITSRIVGDVAQGPITTDAAELIPGSIPTLGQSSNNAGIAALERNARTNPRLSQRFVERDQANSAARSDFYEKLKGDEHTVAAMETARDAATGKLRADAFKNAAAADPAPVVAKIDEILASPSGQRDVVVKALASIKPKLVGEKGPQTDVEQLYGIRKDIDDALSPLASSEKKGSTLAARELLQVKAEIDKAIEKAAPGFRQYLSTYADMSKPVDEQKLLQSLKVTDARGNITLAGVQRGIDRIEAMRGQGGSNKAKSVAADTLANLKLLRDDLKRAGNLDVGKARGSDTAQNLVMGQVAAGSGVPLGIAGAVPILGLPARAAKGFYDAKGERALEGLGTRLLDPEAPAPVVAKAKKPGGPGKRLAAPVLPAAGGVLSSRLIAQ